jgi:two-component system, NtrC family, response regulator HydG
MRATLRIEVGQAMPPVWELSPDRPVTLGRNKTNTIILLDGTASRWHAEVYHEDSKWLVRDFGTLNGTRVNGERISQATPLESGQTIAIGNTRLRFLVGDETPWNGGPRPPAEPAAPPPASLSELVNTSLCVDELTALCQFMAASMEDNDPRALIERALHTVHAQTHATLAGFLSLDGEDPLPRLVYPEDGRVDPPLSRHLTHEVARLGRAVWLGAVRDQGAETDSLVSYQDALCVPLRAGDSPLGALHAYSLNQFFRERDVRFCEVLAGYLANSLRLMRLRRNLEAENSRLRGQSPVGEELIGDSPALKQLRTLVARVAVRPTTVLIAGETGVGKELVALALHRQSPRRDGPLVSLNCAAIAPSLLESELFGHCKGAFSGATEDKPGLFKQADDGTLFLDEVGEMSLECQAKLLRVIEGKGFRPVGATGEVQVDTRIVAATHRDLHKEVDAGRFRQDLLYRLGVITIPVPPLREHAEDIPVLVKHFLARLAPGAGRRVRLSPAALSKLSAYSWPGNVRQLRSVLESALVLCDKDVLEPDDLLLPTDRREQNLPPSLNVEELQEWAFRQVWQRTGGNISQAARELGVSRDTLRSWLKKYGINRDETEG